MLQDGVRSMRVIAIKALKELWATYPESAEALKAWYAIAKEADWKNASDVKAKYRNASILQEGRVVFNIAGNKFRLIVSINYPYRVVYIRFIGTHKQYDKIDAQKI